MASARLLAILQPDGVLIVMMFVAADNQCAAFAVVIRPNPTRLNTRFLNGLLWHGSYARRASFALERYGCEHR